MKTRISIIVAIVLICVVGILTSCGKTTEDNNEVRSQSRLQYTDDGKAIFDGKVYSKVTEIK